MVEFLNESTKRGGVIVDGAGDRDGNKFSWSISVHTETGFISYGKIKEKRFEEQEANGLLTWWKKRLTAEGEALIMEEKGQPDHCFAVCERALREDLKDGIAMGVDWTPLRALAKHLA